MLAGRLAGEVGGPEVARAARRAPRPSHRQLNGDLLLDGRAVLFTDGYTAAMPISRQALGAFCNTDTPPEEGLRWLFLACHGRRDLWDDEGWHALSARHARIARDAGALNVLPSRSRPADRRPPAHRRVRGGRALVEETTAITEATRNGLPPYSALALAGWQGRAGEATSLMQRPSTA